MVQLIIYNTVNKWIQYFCIKYKNRFKFMNKTYDYLTQRISVLLYDLDFFQKFILNATKIYQL